MASRIVRKVKRGKKDTKENIPRVVVTTGKMKVRIKKLEDKTAMQNNPTTSQNVAEFNVNQLIAELSENSKVPRGEIEHIQRKLLQQANEILKVNTFANQPVTQPRVVDTTQKYTNMPIYGRLPVTRNQMDQIEARTALARSDNQLGDTQLVPERLQEMSLEDGGGMINAGLGNMQRVGGGASEAGRGAFFYGTGSAARAAASARAAPLRGAVEVVPPYRMPPAPEAALPGAPAPSLGALHTHSNKFPIEREVILSSGDKNSKVPILQEARKRGRLGAVAPDTPPKALSAWTHAEIEREVILSSGDKNSKVPILQEARKRGRLGAVAPDTPPKALSAWTHAENQQAGTSAEFRQYPDYGYAMQQAGRNLQNYDSPKPPVPAKTFNKPEQNQTITVTVETGKDSTRDAPKSNKSVSKTYHTLKDMISSRFKSKEVAEEKNEPELNNSEERMRSEPEVQREARKEQIYGRPVPQARPEVQNRPEVQRPDMQYRLGVANNMAYPSPSPHRQLITQQQIVQQQMLLHQARSQEMLSPHRSQDVVLRSQDVVNGSQDVALRSQDMVHRSQDLAQRSQDMVHRSQDLTSPHRQELGHRPQALGADALYQQFGAPGRRSAMYQRDLDVRSMANFTSLKTGPQSQFENHSRADLRSPQQLEREIIRQRGLVEGRRAASHPHLLDEPPPRPEPIQFHDRSRRNSHSNLLEVNETPQRQEERESDDGGFRQRPTQSRASIEERIRTSGRSIESRVMQENAYRRTPENHRERATPEIHKERRTPDSHRERRTPDSHRERRTPDSHRERRTPDTHKKRCTPDIHKERRTPDSIAQKQKDEGQVSLVDESASQKSADSTYVSGKTETFNPQPSSSRHTPSRIEDLKNHGKKGTASGTSSDYDKNGGQSSNVDSGRGSVAYSSGRRAEPALDAADSDTAPHDAPAPHPPTTSGENEWADLVECELRQILEPKLAGIRLESSSSDSSVTPPLPPLSPSSDMHKRNSLPGRSSEYADERGRGRESPRWHKKHSHKRDQHYKKHLFGVDTTDMTSTTTRSLDLSSLLDARSDSDASGGDARAIRRQLRGLENMYAEVLQLLGVRKPASLSKHPAWEARLSSKRRYGSMSSLPSSSVSSRPARDKRPRAHDHRKKHDLKSINKRFQRLESHVVTLARSVAHLSSEMRSHHLLVQEVDSVRAELAALRHMYKSQQYIRSGQPRHLDPSAFSNPERVKRLTKFFGDEPPLMRLFLKKLGYEKYAALLEKEKVGAAELPYVGEDKLRALGVPLGPRMRILKEAGVSDRDHTTTTTLAIV